MNKIIIRIFGRNILNAIKYNIMAYQIQNSRIPNETPIVPIQITQDNYAICQGGKTTVSLLRKLMKLNPDTFNGFLYYDQDSHLIGYVWLLCGGV